MKTISFFHQKIKELQNEFNILEHFEIPIYFYSSILEKAPLELLAKIVKFIMASTNFTIMKNYINNWIQENGMKIETTKIEVSLQKLDYDFGPGGNVHHPPRIIATWNFILTSGEKRIEEIFGSVHGSTYFFCHCEDKNFAQEVKTELELYILKNSQEEKIQNFSRDIGIEIKELKIELQKNSNWKNQDEVWEIIKNIEDRIEAI